MNSTFYTRFGKRWLDATTSFFALLLLSPLLLLVAIAVRLTSPGPALFSQTRVGQFERPFLIFKFRTMKQAPVGAGSLLTAAGDSRITPLGHWLRKTKIDELPQLFNVLAGQMSLVGPRPEVPCFSSAYSESDKSVFRVRPGITGPSIIFNEEELMAGQPDKELFYRTTVLPSKLKIDLCYSANIRFLSDLRYLALTVSRLFSHQISGPSASDSIQHLATVTEGVRRQSG